MKRIHFNKLAKIMILITFSIAIIISFFTYQDYQKAKQIYKDDSPVKIVADSINDDLKISSYHVEDAVNAQFERILTNTYIVYDEELNPYLPASETWSMTINSNNKESVISLKQLNYDQLKILSQYLLSQVSENNIETINVTLNYDQNNNDFIEVSKLSYLAFDEQVILGQANSSTITCQLVSLDCPLITIYEYDSDYAYNYTLQSYENLEKCFKKNYQNLDQNGYYQNIDSNQKQILETTSTITSSICIQELSGKYSQHTDFNELYGINDFNEKGYLVWYQFDGLFEEYTFFDYLATHYYNYLLSLILLGMIYLGVGIIFAEKKQIPVSPDSKASSFDSIPENIEEIDISQLITQLVHNSANVLNFKKIKLSYKPQMMIIKGNREQIIDLVTRLYNFSLRHSNQNDELIIELNHHKITFLNNNFNYLDDDLKILNDCIEIIKRHQYHYSFTNRSLSIKIGA